jgi:hypothetical protein
MREAKERRSTWPDQWGVILFRGRTVAPSLAEAETRVRIFARHFLSSGCGAIANYAALPGEQTARGEVGRTTGRICARRHRPRDERRDQRQPKSLGCADRSSPRHARFSLPISAIRVGAVHEAKRPVERVNLLNSSTRANVFRAA